MWNINPAKLSLVTLICSSMIGCASQQSHDHAAHSVKMPQKSIVATAVSAGKFKTLVAAIQAALVVIRHPPISPCGIVQCNLKPHGEAVNRASQAEDRGQGAAPTQQAAPMQQVAPTQDVSK